jgi:flagellar motility protein MotE (MotC chaperone)
LSQFFILTNKLNEVQTKFEETENLDKTLKDNLNSLEKEKEKLLDNLDELEIKFLLI